jgi:acyl-CoA thioesterase FadM
MHPYLRLAGFVAASFTGPRLGPLDTSRLSMRVMPVDVELTRMNHGRYLTLMDLGRFDFTFRCNLLAPLLKNRWFPIVSSMTARYRRSLRLGEKYELVTRIAAFNHKYWYMDQRFEVGGDVAMNAYVKGIFRGPKGNVPTPELLEAAGHPGTVSPPMPEAIRLWQVSELAAR